MERLHRPIQGRDDEIERTERLLLEPLQLFLEVDASRTRGGHDVTRTCP
jgi:hypothetical protein